MSGVSLHQLAIEAQTSFPALLQWLQAERPYELEEHEVKRGPLERSGTTPHVFERVSFHPKAHKPPHPVYIEGKTILGKTKYGIPVTPEQFQNNSFLKNGKDAEDLSGEQWWIAEQTARFQGLEKLDSRVETGSIVSLTPSEKFDLEAWQRERKAKGFYASRNQKHDASRSSLSNYRRWLEENEAVYNFAEDAEVRSRSSFTSSTEQSEYGSWIESPQTVAQQEINAGYELESYDTSESVFSVRTATVGLPYEGANIRVVDLRQAQPAIRAPRERRLSGHSNLMRSLSKAMKSKYSRYTETEMLTLQEYLDSQPAKRGKIDTEKPEGMSVREYMEYKANQKEPRMLYNIKRVIISIPSIPSILKGIFNTKPEARKYRRHIQVRRSQIGQKYQIALGNDQSMQSESVESLLGAQTARTVRGKKQILYQARRPRVRFQRSKKFAPYNHLRRDDDTAFPEVTEDRHLWIARGFDFSDLHENCLSGCDPDHLNEIASDYEKDCVSSGYLAGGFEAEDLGDFDYLPPLEKRSQASTSTTTTE